MGYSPEGSLKVFAKQLTFVASLLALVATSSAQDANVQTSTLKKIQQTNTIVIAHREAYLPFSFLDPNKKPIGYSLDLCHKIISAIKNELKLPGLQVKYVMVDPSNRIQTIKEGKADLECSGTTHTLSRRKDVDFSLSVMISASRLVVRKSTGIKEIEDLNGKKIAAASNTTMLKGAKQVAKDAKIEPKFIETKDHDAAFAMMVKGEVDAAVLEDLVALPMIAKEKEPTKYMTTGRDLSFDPNALMLRQNDSDFRAVVDRALARTFTSGEIFQIYEKWFKPLNQPVTEAFKGAVRAQSIPE